MTPEQLAEIKGRREQYLSDLAAIGVGTWSRDDDFDALLDEVERLRAVAEAARILIAEVEPVIARLDDGGEVGDFTLHLDPLRDAVRARERA
jgi:hypothetical protein